LPSRKSFKCRQCGWCCRNVVINVSHSDIQRWLRGRRKDILDEVSFIDNYPKQGTGGFYIRTTAFNPKQPCPFHCDEGCSIYETRPIACRDYPLASVSAGCPVFDDVSISEGRKKNLKRRQYADFRQAHDKRNELIRLLVEVRHWPT
jgi:Fe-S-cluster containining protein